MNDSSTGAMQNHVKRFHPELLPEGVGPERPRARAPADDGSALPANPEAARDYALGVVLGDMQPINSVARAGLSSFLAKHAKVSLTRAPLSARQPAILSLGLAAVAESPGRLAPGAFGPAARGFSWAPDRRAAAGRGVPVRVGPRPAGPERGELRAERH